MYPCHRAVAIAPPECPAASVSLRRSILPSLYDRELGLWGLAFRGHLCVHSRYGPMTRSPSQEWLCQSTSFASFPPRMRSKLQRSDFSSGGLVPTEYISFLLDIRSYSQADQVPSSQVTCNSPCSPWINCRMLLALVSTIASITIWPLLFSTAITIASLCTSIPIYLTSRLI